MRDGNYKVWSGMAAVLKSGAELTEGVCMSQARVYTGCTAELDRTMAQAQPFLGNAKSRLTAEISWPTMWRVQISLQPSASSQAPPDFLPLLDDALKTGNLAYTACAQQTVEQASFNVCRSPLLCLFSLKPRAARHQQTLENTQIQTGCSRDRRLYHALLCAVRLPSRRKFPKLVSGQVLGTSTCAVSSEHVTCGTKSSSFFSI